MTLTELMGRMRVRPGLFLGIKSLTRFQMFIYGWHLALYDRNGETDEDRSDRERLRRFHDYVGRKYQMVSELGWLAILLSQVDSDERAALDLFWHNWDEFISTTESNELVPDVQLAENILHLEEVPDE